MATDLDSLLPQLRPGYQCHQPALGEAAFGESTVWLPLSAAMNAFFTYTPAGCTTKVELTHRGLEDLGLSVRQVWNRAALNLFRSAYSDAGIRFWTRPTAAVLGPQAPRGMQIKTDVGPASAWLAHPRTFTTLHRHVHALTGARSLTYVLPDEATVFALVDCPTDQAASLAKAIAQTSWVGSTNLCDFPLRWLNGFPEDVSATSHSPRNLITVPD